MKIPTTTLYLNSSSVCTLQYTGRKLSAWSRLYTSDSLDVYVKILNCIASFSPAFQLSDSPFFFLKQKITLLFWTLTHN